MSERRAHRYRVVDVFTETPLEGNPIRGLSRLLRSRSARDASDRARAQPRRDRVRLSGDAQGLRGSVAHLPSPAHEMVFAGHPTIGASWKSCKPKASSHATASTSCSMKALARIPIRIEQATTPPLIWLSTPPVHAGKNATHRRFARSCSASMSAICSTRRHNGYRASNPIRSCRCREGCRPRWIAPRSIAPASRRCKPRTARRFAVTRLHADARRLWPHVRTDPRRARGPRDRQRDRTRDVHDAARPRRRPARASSASRAPRWAGAASFTCKPVPPKPHRLMSAAASRR